MAKNLGHAVQLATFKKWGYDAEGIVAKIVTLESGKVMVEEVYCKLCAKHSNRILSELKGQALKDASNFIEGTNFVTKSSVGRHFGSQMHRAALDFEKIEKEAGGGTSSSSSTSANTLTAERRSQRQPRIDTTLHTNARCAYQKLIKTAYFLAVDGQPLSSFRTLVKCQKSNGVKLIDGCDDGHAARELVHEIADVIREKLAVILCSARAYSVLSDGTQARKTGKEKELVMVRLVREGIPVYYCVSLVDVDEYGDATAENLKVCIDDVFLKKVGISKELYVNGLVSMTADGASVNFGQYNGLLTRLSKDRPWLVKIHCVSHRLELAIKDSVMKEKRLSDVKDFMMTLYYLFKQSGKVKQHFESYGLKVLGATVYIFPKVHGTRFVAHIRRGLHHLLHNWGILYAVCENGIGSNDPNMRGIKPKLRGVLKKLKDGSFFLTCAVMKQVLDTLSQLSLTLERGSINVFDVKVLIDKTKSSLDDIRISDISDTFTYLHDELGITVAADADGVPPGQVSWQIPKKNHNRRKVESREYITVTAKCTGVRSETTLHNAEVLRNRLIPTILTCLDTRFTSFQSDLFMNMTWLDPANWHDSSAELRSVKFIADHFSTTLAFAGFKPYQLKKEWLDLQRTVRYFYHGVKANKLWEKIFTYRKESFPNLLMVVEIVLVLGPSNSIVEKGFSQLSSMLSDRRLSSGPGTIEDLLLIKVNNLSWTPKERDHIIQATLDKHMEKRRKLILDQTPFNLLAASAPPSKRKRLSDDAEPDGGYNDPESDVNETLDDDDDDENDDVALASRPTSSSERDDSAAADVSEAGNNDDMPAAELQKYEGAESYDDYEDDDDDLEEADKFIGQLELEGGGEALMDLDSD